MATQAYYQVKADEHRAAAAAARRKNKLELEQEHLRRAKQYEELAEKATS